jgi:exopolysaccharide biosynthesis polyprenyl glycosylphosphotransferase
MITKRERNLSKILVGFQVLITLFVFFETELIYQQKHFNSQENIYFLLQIIVIWGLFLYKFRLGIVFRAVPFFERFRGYLVTVLFGITVFYIEIKFLPFIRDTGNSLKFNVLFGLLDISALIAFKTGFYYLMRFLRRTGHNTRHLIIIADSKSSPFINYFIKSKDWGYHIVGIFSPDPDFKGKFQNIKVLKPDINLKSYITSHPIDDIFYCLSIDDKRFDLEQLIIDTEEIGVSLHIMQQSYLESLVTNTDLQKKFDHSFITHTKVPANYISIKIKDAFDLFFSVLVLIGILPFGLLFAFLIWVEDGGPVLFKQERIGLNGRRFVVFKFRTMVIDAEKQLDDLHAQNEVDGPVFKIENDPRITHVGKFLRKTSLDELPQFYNVIKGEMSVVGPRPPLLREVIQYERSQLRRLSMKPGITCIWQVNGRNSVSFKEWMKMDLQYIDNWSIWLDVKLMFKTVIVIFKANGR